MRPELDNFRNTKVGNILSLVAATAAAAIGANAVKATVSPNVASANPADATCTVTTEGNTETEICTSPSDPSYRSEKVTTIDDGEEVQEQVAPPPQPPKAEQKPPKKPRKRSHTRPKSERQIRINSQKDFPGYEMSASSFTSGNGCFITGAGSSLRRETGNKHIRPTSNRLYHPALRRQWNPIDGVTQGLLFNALPAMAAQYNVQVRGGVQSGQRFDTEDFKDIRKAKRQNDEVMILAAAGHFTSGGHYMSIRKVTRNRRLVIDDPNGKGKYGDSERPEGWSARELIDGGVIDYRVLHLKGAK